MQLCCQRKEVTVAAASEAIEESRGIGTITRFEGNLQITFNPEFYNYCIERWEVLGGKKTPSEDDVDWVRRRYSEFIKSASAQVTDRNARAFRVPTARAAWKSFIENDPTKALEYYELAVLADPENGWLFDRYAYTLMKMKRFDVALTQSKNASSLLPNDPEVLFTKGMIEARLGNLDTSLDDLNRAQASGKPANLCELQKAYAYVYCEPKDIDSAREALERARRLAPKDQFFSRFISEATRFERRWLSLPPSS
jgi:tetratricopeptide (TPR) repeat protein